MSENTHSELRRRFVRSFLDLVVLRMLLDEPFWGYRIMSKMKEAYGIKVGPPVIYPLLESLESEGLLECNEIYDGKRKRKVYNTTALGVEKIKQFTDVLGEFSGLV